MLRIQEIKHRMSQGMTKPLLCHAENGYDYVVKGWSAGRKALIAEWLAGCLGRELKLPIPPFSILSLDRAWAAFSAHADAIRLSNGPAFGSQWVPNAYEVLGSEIPKVPVDLRTMLLLFDWWICNPDRIWVGSGGNPNLLWLASEQGINVIDHNLAFQPGQTEKFWEEHIFREDRSRWDDSFQATAASRLRSALSRLEEFWNAMPDEWTGDDCGVSLGWVRDLLSRFETNPDTFWGDR